MNYGNLFHLASKRLARENAGLPNKYRYYGKPKISKSGYVSSWQDIYNTCQFYGLSTMIYGTTERAYIESPFRLEKVVDYAKKIRKWLDRHGKRGAIDNAIEKAINPKEYKRKANRKYKSKKGKKK